jgi:hypothetical protein
MAEAATQFRPRIVTRPLQVMDFFSRRHMLADVAAIRHRVSGRSMADHLPAISLRVRLQQTT